MNQNSTHPIALVNPSSQLYIYTHTNIHTPEQNPNIHMKYEYASRLLLEFKQPDDIKNKSVDKNTYFNYLTLNKHLDFIFLLYLCKKTLYHMGKKIINCSTYSWLSKLLILEDMAILACGFANSASLNSMICLGHH